MGRQQSYHADCRGGGAGGVCNVAVDPLCNLCTFAFIKTDANVAEAWKYCRTKCKDGKHVASI